MTEPCLPGGYGPTTGTCAAAAARAAAAWLEGEAPGRVEIALPEGGRIGMEIVSAGLLPGGAEASVVKPDNADDDVTKGLTIRVRISRRPGTGIAFAAGEGVGTATLPGLSIPPGEPAINPTPRRMIAQALAGLEGGWLVEVSVPGGREAAEKTYNPRLGITGGISILGTSGLVRPFCRAARRAGFLCSFSVARESGHAAPVMVPGHIGRRAVAAHFNVRPEQLLEVGNAWDDAFELVRGYPFASILIAGHPGKLAKLAAGPVDTHSGRSGAAIGILRETLAAIALAAPEEAATAEALFAALPPEQRLRLASAAAERVRQALLRPKPAADVAVWLCDLAGAELGSAGDLSPWL